MASYNNSQRSSSNLKVFSYKFKVRKIPFRKDKESLLPPSLNWTLNRDMGVGLVKHWSLLSWSEVLGSQVLSLEQTRSPNHPILFTKTVGKKTFTARESFKLKLPVKFKWLWAWEILDNRQINRRKDKVHLHVHMRVFVSLLKEDCPIELRAKPPNF